MSEYTMAVLKNGKEILPDDKFKTFIIKCDGVEIGELDYDRGRWKSAGGPAWRGRLYGEFPNNITYYNKSRRHVLDWFKTGVCK